MMNDEMEQFEQRLSRQPVRKVPSAWRAEILAAARAAQPAPQVTRAEKHRSFLSTIHTQLSTLLWPHPKAWAGLAAVWVAILALHLVSSDKLPQVAERTSAFSPQVAAQLKEQRRLFAELAESGGTYEAARPKETPNRPRTQRVEIMAA